MKSKKLIAMFTLMFLVLILTGCAPNNEKYLSESAGFWAGLWHGLICFITFIISLFTDGIGIYEVHNTGRWYNFGFILGALIGLGHGGWWGPVGYKYCSKGGKEKEWENIGVKVEEKVRTGIRKWLDETDKNETDWEEIGKKVEEKIKRELRNWAEK